MRRAVPIGNKLCAEKEQQHMEKERLRRLRNMKCQVDHHAPKVCGMAHLKTNWKRDEIAACRFDEIERDNRHLLSKMSHVARESGMGSPHGRHSRSMPSLPPNSAFSFPGGPARKNEII